MHGATVKKFKNVDTSLVVNCVFHKVSPIMISIFLLHVM